MSRSAGGIGRLLQRVQRDEGGRGIAKLVQAAGTDELFTSATELFESDTVVLTTGFPCLQHETEEDEWGAVLLPQENDGPPGLAAVVRALGKLGKRCIIAIEHSHSLPVELCIQAALQDVDENPKPENDNNFATTESQAGNISNETVNIRQLADRIELHKYPTGVAWCDKTEATLRNLVAVGDHFVAIERAGAGYDGKCRTMKGRVMGEDLLGPLHTLFAHAHVKESARTTGIGDGGNEVGMGKLYDVVKSTIPLGEEIGCTVAANHLVVCSVSNWGGYALAGALAMIATERRVFESHADAARELMGDRQRALRVLQACVAGGARDGVTKRGDTVDALSFDCSLQTFQDLFQIVHDADTVFTNDQAAQA